MHVYPAEGLGFQHLGQDSAPAPTRAQATVQHVVQGAVQAVTAPIVLAWWLVTIASVGISAYHGYRRGRGSVTGALGWGALGAFFPVIVPAVALIQGYAKPATVKKNRRKSRRGGHRLKRRSR